MFINVLTLNEMKTYITFIILLSYSLVGISQSKKELKDQVTILTIEKQKLTDEKQKLIEDILSLKQQILDIKTENLTIKTEYDQLKNSVSVNSNVSAISSNQTSTNQSTSSSETTRERCLATTAKGTQCTRLADIGSKYCWQHKATYEPRSTSTTNDATSKSTSTPSKGSGASTSSGRTIITGPRGGQYYINKNGNKTYIKK